MTSAGHDDEAAEDKGVVATTMSAADRLAEECYREMLETENEESLQARGAKSANGLPRGWRWRPRRKQASFSAMRYCASSWWQQAPSLLLLLFFFFFHSGERERDEWTSLNWREWELCSLNP